jgi:four helix bundle protein
VSGAPDIDERAFRLLCDVIRSARAIEPQPGIRRLLDQPVAATGSVGANRQEAAAASSRRECIRYNEIALRSANEAALWLRAFTETGVGDRTLAPALLDEARQLARILGAIVVSAKRGASNP